MVPAIFKKSRSTCPGCCNTDIAPYPSPAQARQTPVAICSLPVGRSRLPPARGLAEPKCPGRAGCHIGNLTQYDLYETNYELIADMLANDLIIGWVSGKYEIGPRALGNRSILAAPFQECTRVRLNEIKQREQFRPIAPVCLEEEAARWFGCDEASPFMLFYASCKNESTSSCYPRERDCSHSDSVICDQSKFVRSAYRIQGTYRIRRLV